MIMVAQAVGLAIEVKMALALATCLLCLGYMH